MIHCTGVKHLLSSLSGMQEGIRFQVIMVRTVTVALFKERRQKPYGSFKNEQNLKQTHLQQYNEELNMLEIKISLPNITNKRKRGRERRRKERRRE